MRNSSPYCKALLALPPIALAFALAAALALAATGTEAAAVSSATASAVDVHINVNQRRHRHSSVSLGIHLSGYPDLVAIPGIPVMYDPHLVANYFFHEGSFWVFAEDDWYRSDEYDGPWTFVERDDVPVFLLRIPVRYFNRAPLYFRPWALDMAPRWSLRWGREWDRRHRGWDRWDRRKVPPMSPPPAFPPQPPQAPEHEHPRGRERPERPPHA